MVSAVSAFGSMFYANNRINAGNATLNNYHAMNMNVDAASRRARTLGSARNPMLAFAGIQAREKELVSRNLHNSLLYKIACAQEDAMKEKEKKEQQRKLDIMA